MKLSNKVKYLILGFCVLSVLGCASISPLGRELMIGTMSDASVLVLNKNKNALPVIKEISATLDGILTGTPLTKELVDYYLNRLENSQSLDDTEKVVFGRAILRTYNLIVAEVKMPVLSVDNPKVKEILERINQELKIVIKDAEKIEI